jgi:ubiquitin-conjugating enzyme E2 A
MIVSRVDRKLLRELKAITQENGKDCAVGIVDGNITHWKISLFGPPQTDWEGAILQLSVKFSPKYPIEAPDIRFVGVIPFHPNVYANGKICLDLIQHNWSAAYSIDSVITALQALLQNPNPNSPANNTAAELFTKNIGGLSTIVLDPHGNLPTRINKLLYFTIWSVVHLWGKFDNEKFIAFYRSGDFWY